MLGSALELCAIPGEWLPLVNPSRADCGCGFSGDKRHPWKPRMHPVVILWVIVETLHVYNTGKPRTIAIVHCGGDGARGIEFANQFPHYAPLSRSQLAALFILLVRDAPKYYRG